jgi:hypothetical protein
MRMTVNLRGLIILVAFWSLFVVGLSVRFGLAAVIVATVIDWLYVAAPVLPGRGRDGWTS